jgi:hypothetical protein
VSGAVYPIWIEKRNEMRMTKIIDFFIGMTSFLFFEILNPQSAIKFGF